MDYANFVMEVPLLKPKSCHDNKFIVAGITGGCHCKDKFGIVTNLDFQWPMTAVLA